MRRWVHHFIYTRHEKMLGKEAVATICTHLESLAMYEGEEHELGYRAVRHGDAIWYDLADKQW